MKTLIGDEIGLNAFLSIDSDAPLSIFIGHEYGASVVTLEEFIEESKIDMDSVLRQKYACAFEIMAKQLRS